MFWTSQTLYLPLRRVSRRIYWRSNVVFKRSTNQTNVYFPLTIFSPCFYSPKTSNRSRSGILRLISLDLRYCSLGSPHKSPVTVSVCLHMHNSKAWIRVELLTERLRALSSVHSTSNIWFCTPIRAVAFMMSSERNLQSTACTVVWDSKLNTFCMARDNREKVSEILNRMKKNE